MKITSSVEYATRLMTALARNHGNPPLSAEKLSESENVPVDYINQLLLKLRRAGLVQSHRGAAGGYGLSQEPSAVTLGQVFRAVEGGLLENVCEKYAAGNRDCHHQSRCGISPVWLELGELIERYLESVTLADVILREPGVSGSRVSPPLKTGSGSKTPASRGVAS